MKKRWLSFLLVVGMLLLGLMGFVACNDDPTTPQKLSTPVITLTENVASWEGDSNADKFEISLDGNLSYVENTVTSKILIDGQTLKVRAVGDGNAYSTSDWSNSVTYTASKPESSSVVEPESSSVVEPESSSVVEPDSSSVVEPDSSSVVEPAPTPTDAPTYLGIFASNNQPSQADGLPDVFTMRTKMMRMGSYRVFGTALSEYFVDSNNHFNAELPATADYEVFSRAGEIVYVQIWLNNPNQYTILSLKLNGTKYQVGGGLSSFFIEDNEQHYNCIYVAITIPNDAYTEKSYTVTDIEYISNTYINADGSDEFMNNNDTVSIGLPYNAENPNVLDFIQTALTINSYSATLTVEDIDGLVHISGGWLGIAVYDGYNVVANQSLVIGNNSVSATGLVESTDYWIIVYLYADLHDGNGVTAHVLFEQHIFTPEAIVVEEVSGTLLYNAEKDGYYGAIKVNTALNSETAEYIKLEILKDGEVVYTDTNYNGTTTVSTGILCGASYDIRVYYKDTEYPDGKYIEESAWINSLGTPWYQEAGVYTFVNDAVYYFQLSNGDENYPAIDSFTLKLYKEESARWYASDILYILNNPTAIEDLETQIDELREQFNAAYGNHELMNQIHAEMSALEEELRPLEDALWYLENRADNNTDITYWQAEAAKGKYFYEFEYNGADTERVFKVGKYYYVVLDDALTYGINGLDIELNYKYDKLDGNGLIDGEVNYESINLDRELTNHWVEMENVSYADGKLTLTLYNEEDWLTGVRPPYAIGYVYKVMVDGEVLYLDDSTHQLNIDEAAWFNEYIQRIKTGQSLDGLMEKYVPDYESSYTVSVDATKLTAGNRNFEVYIRLVATDYEDDEYHACRTEYVEIYAPLPTPSIEFNEYEGHVVHDWIDNWGGGYSYEAEDKNGNPVTISNEGGSSFNLPMAGTKVRVKLMADGYWLESEWSEWYTFEGISVTAPTFGEYSTVNCTISWSVSSSDNISHYVYTLNGGEEITVALDSTPSVYLNNGDVLRVKCVPTADALTNGYKDSEWVEYICNDNRTALVTPTNVKIDDSGCLVWDAVDGANYYVIEITYEGETYETRFGKTSYSGASEMPGATYRVRAMPKDAETQRSSAWSESVTYTGE